MNENLKRVLLSMSGFVALLIIWQVVSSLSYTNKTLLSSPSSTFSAFGNLIIKKNILIDVSQTVGRMLLGFSLATILGVLTGLIIGTSKNLHYLTNGVIDFFRSIPITILYPIFIMLYGIKSGSKIAMIFVACIFVIILNTAYGVMQANPLRQKTAKVFGASKPQIFKWITLYSALPQALIGMRTAISLSLIISILCEMFMGSRYGIGQKVMDSFTTYQIPELYALIIMAGIIGFLFNWVFVKIEKRIIPWVGMT